MKIGYGKSEKQIAASCWGHNLSSRHDFPDHTNSEVLDAVHATYDANRSDYENMMAANRVLNWIKG